MKTVAAWLMLAFSNVCLAQYLDASNFEEAVAMAAVDVKVAEATRWLCTQALPERALDVHSMSLGWLDQNRKEYLAVLAYSRTASPAWKLNAEKAASTAIAPYAALPRGMQAGYCDKYYGSIKGGAQNIARRTPRVSKLLSEYLARNPLPEELQESSDFVFGCVKQANNRAVDARSGFNLDEAFSVCQCAVDVHQSRTTPEERMLEKKYLAEGRPVAELAHMQRVGPLMANCRLNR